MDIQLLSLIFFQSILKERSWRVLASASTFYFSLRYDILQCIFKIFELFVILSYGLLYRLSTESMHFWRNSVFH